MYLSFYENTGWLYALKTRLCKENILRTYAD